MLKACVVAQNARPGPVVRTLVRRQNGNMTVTARLCQLAQRS